jgi:hypothetical protein
MPQVGVAWLSSRVLPRARIVCAFPFWFVFIAEANLLHGRLGLDSARVGMSEGLLVPGRPFDGRIPLLLK